MMKLFNLELLVDSPPGYDCTVRAVVSAENEEQARALVNEHSKNGDEHIRNPNCWLNPKLTSCVEIDLSHQSNFIMLSPV